MSLPRMLVTAAENLSYPVTEMSASPARCACFPSNAGLATKIVRLGHRGHWTLDSGL